MCVLHRVREVGQPFPTEAALSDLLRKDEHTPRMTCGPNCWSSYWSPAFFSFGSGPHGDSRHVKLCSEW